MKSFNETLDSKQFIVTTELNPPKGTDLGPLFAKAEMLRDTVDAFILTDSHASIMTMSNGAVAHHFVGRGIETIVGFSCRDRNRIALQSDLLSAYSLGVRNILCMTGDWPEIGDHPEALPVFELDSIQLLKTVATLSKGEDLSGKRLKGQPDLLAGAVFNPTAPDRDLEISRLKSKVEAGAQFFQTQAVFDSGTFEAFLSDAGEIGAPVIAGIIMLKSGNMARRINTGLPGISIPDWMIDEMDRADNPTEKSIEIAVRTIERIRPLCQGINLMTVGREELIPVVLHAAGIQDSEVKTRTPVPGD